MCRLEAWAPLSLLRAGLGVGRSACSKRELLGDQKTGPGGGGWRPGLLGSQRKRGLEAWVPERGAYGWNPLFLEEEGPGGPDF